MCEGLETPAARLKRSGYCHAHQNLRRPMSASTVPLGCEALSRGSRTCVEQIKDLVPVHCCRPLCYP
eukprot:12920357-Prorocentrum_lima.AAC.1